ncbi:hypothetical protein K9M48_01705 [Candidatus Gracilibacteria bacterium]|nr:hypothetical protein [Candidatus Gracilibacteria bacterium]
MATNTKNQKHFKGNKGGGKEYSGLNNKNKPFDIPEIQKIKSEKIQANVFEKKEELINSLDKKGWAKQSTADGIFNELNQITFKKNWQSNKYLKDFEAWLSQKTSSGKSKSEVFDILKRVYTKFTVHGKKTANGNFLNRADLDAQASLLLLELSGFKEGKIWDNVGFVENEDVGEGVTLDTGNAGGMKLEVKEKKDDKGRKSKTLFNSKLILDEHNGGPCSTTRIVYQILKKFGKIPHDKMEQIKRFVEFIDIADDLGYQASGIVSPYLERTIFGLHKMLPASFILNYFKDSKKTGFEYLNDEFLAENKVSYIDFKSGKNIGKSLKEISKEKKSRMNLSYKQLSKLEHDGSFLMYDDSRFIVDIGGKLIDAQEAVQTYGYGLIRVFPKTGDLYIYSPKKFIKDIGGFKIKNDHFIIDKGNSGKDISKLLKEFDMLPERKFGESTDPGSSHEIKQKIVDCRKNFVVKEKMANEQDNIDFSGLSNLEGSDIGVGKVYSGIINNVIGNMMFITLNSKNTVRARLHKSKLGDRNIKDFNVGDKIRVKILSKEGELNNTKIEVSFDSIEKSIAA